MKNFFVLNLAFLLFSFAAIGKTTLKVKNEAELKTAISNAKPGDEIILSNGTWKNIQIKFDSKGTKDNPITLRAETSGKVSIEGVSDLKIGGSYLVIRGLYFRNGYTPSKSVIDFHIDSSKIANNCIVTDCVIEDFTQLNRVRSDHWIEFWGRHNELSNSYLSGKSNQGPTIMVILEGNEQINNYHKIINNHFGPRPRKGGPHGETIQIGDSGTSMASSYTIVEHNLFERCDGEVEIISNKSNNNIYRDNIFYKSEGSLVLRHGNYCTIDSNIFIGDENSDFMGGIRLINTGHWITNNYFYKIKGNEFRSALAVMNGVPKSPQNRYNQVTDAVVAYNTFVDCGTPWQLSVGANMDKSAVLPAQEIRSARPTRTIIANNLIYNSGDVKAPIKAYDKIDGILFKNNIINTDYESKSETKELQRNDFTLNKQSDWLYVPTANQTDVYNGFDFENITKDVFGNGRNPKNGIGAMVLPVEKNKGQINKKDFGTSWFSNDTLITKPKTVQVSTQKEFLKALSEASSNTIIELKSGIYKITESLKIDKTIAIQSRDKKSKAILEYNGANNTAAFLMLPKGNLVLNAVILKGKNTQNAFTTKEKEMSSAYNLKIENSEISQFDYVLKAYKDSFSDTIAINNSIIKDCKNGISLAAENDDLGEYNAEFLLITNTKFSTISNYILDYYRGGYDESTIGGNLIFDNNSVINSGKLEASGTLLKLQGIVNVTISNNIFSNNAVKTIAVLWGEKEQVNSNNKIDNSGEFKTEQNLKQKMMY
ncbi:chondroitinase-B domain-containing protein [Flavobacterium quisquiliarum]|uniref:Chondroitinase-B domain-containing protein n=1 Tax=Flavobacterium quisquiliarum TaxID=1834436 RepID=A0ABV8W4R4_9FLAO|nr:chondroitinase-B domain-containing protein [Flavobacterium quisquiliarum]MBW1654259.1 alginate lyase [Flavobacterium quisquiliarum]NWL03302.1 alginate lyase [Flavobacterium collinsii]